MSPPSRNRNAPELTSQLDMLSALGFGPDTLLMNDPKLFVDGRFLTSLLVELDEELGESDASLALFQIGLLHGLRDAARMTDALENELGLGTSGGPAATTSLVMQWAAGAGTPIASGIELRGSWPERYEAIARCARLGSTTGPSCWLSAGYTSGWLGGTLDAELIVREIECAATGARACRFEVREAAAWPARADPMIDQILARVPFEAYRELATSPAAAPQAGMPEGCFDRSQAVVHIWGPVMVLPFTTLDEALGTVDMLRRDPAISEIRSVVVDLREQPIDEGFGAAALEQILETIESWNAQSLIAGVGPSAEAAIAGLEASHLVVRKDLPEAIATAFQIAEAQRHHI